jgi:hypothetical protein
LEIDSIDHPHHGNKGERNSKRRRYFSTRYKREGDYIDIAVEHNDQNSNQLTQKLGVMPYFRNVVPQTENEQNHCAQCVSLYLLVQREKKQDSYQRARYDPDTPNPGYGKGVYLPFVRLVDQP